MSDDAKRRKYVVSGVCCASEEGLLRKSLDASLGPERYSFSLLSSEVQVDPTLSDSDVLHAVRRAGFSCRQRLDTVPSSSGLFRDPLVLTTAVAALCTMGGILSEFLEAPELLARVLLLSGIVAGGWHIAVKARAALVNRMLDMNVLMTIAVIGALSIGRWSEGAAVVVLFSLALLLESFSAARTRRAVQSLMELSPQQACVVRGNHEEIVPATEISPGEMLIVRPGEKIPLDGEVLDGVSAVDQAHLTGESIPVEKKSGDTVFAGSLNGRGSLSIRSTHRYEETTLARIIQLIEAAEHKRAPIQRFIDTFARVYTPAVLGLALLIAVLPPLLLHAEWMVWIYRALVLLVIACPCALVISTPVTLVSALTRGARHGVLIKGGKDLEVLSRTRAVAFDKTGTLTDGLLRVTDILPLDHTSPDTLLQTVAALEHRSEHVLADGLVAEARSRGLTYESVRVTRFESLPGRGVAADVDGTTYFLGNRELCQEHQFCTPDVTKILDTCEAEGKTTVVLGVRGKALGVIALQDRLRPRTSFVMDALRKSGIQRTVILSGDHETAVARVGREAGIDAWESGLLPDQKVQRIETLQHQWGIVAMVGDGINDAPALASASVGIAMGGAGSDTALESADVVLMSDSLEKLPFVFDLSKNAVRIIRQNIAIALGLKLLFFVLALTGTSTLWMAILADDGAALLVILNGLRMLGFGKEKD